VAIEVMASSDNVLRAGLTQKHIDVAELTRVMTFDELEHPNIDGVIEQQGVTLWQPDVPDFSVRRVQLNGGAKSVVLGAEYPLVLICTEGKIVAERSDDGLDEFANLAQGQALYISSGDPVTFSGKGELFLATVGAGWGKGSRFGEADEK
jgi:mannose-6-phosphate isomerase